VSRSVLCSDYCFHIPFHMKIRETAYTHLLVAGITRLISRLATGWTVWVSYPNRDRRLFLLQNHLDWLWGPPSFLLDGYFLFSLLFSFFLFPFCLSLFLFFLSPGVEQWCVMAITYCPPAPRIRMSGVTPLLPLYAFVACLWTTVHLTLP